ncbi:MAG: hypothetical protein RJB39_404 [Candidatus Parcubacteria bacterium]|jgi:hypothetical protein
MTSLEHQDFGSDRELSTETREKLESMSNIQLAYKLAHHLAYSYDVGGHSVGRSQRSELLDMFMHLNRTEDVPGVDQFTLSEYIQQEAAKRDIGVSPSLLHAECDTQNPKVMSAIVLHVLMRHYKEQVGVNDSLAAQSGVSSNDINFSFKRELPMITLIYNLYISQLEFSEAELSGLAEGYTVEALREMVAQ